ncbi:3-oxo-tetronate 4-phosphate decarboxylase [Thalassospira australica]|uniref:3-oxo-tetronate 4-phosphate decarboxylase n=1 Tax=Thalassospira australica TaxID=1528106 RepID=UPI00051A6576|nr:3-oxo-tetronate 4-phosphate decarboxylase [Thalassospira australica]
MTSENKLREQICRLSASLFERGLTFGASGNISVRLDDGWLMTPTGSSMGNLDPARLSRLDQDGNLISGDKPTKEAFLHQCMYDGQKTARAVVHLHSSYSAAVSCMDCGCTHSVLPPLTPYFVMRIGSLPLVPYYPPGDINLAKAVKELAGDHHAVLLANHGPVVAGDSLENAIYATEELEETAKLFLLLQGQKTRPLNDEQVAHLKQKFGGK